MKKRELIFLLVSGIILTTQADAARGRQPCSGSKGGIAHCTSDGRFVCNDGTLSQSKRFCCGYSPSEGSNRLTPSTSSRKKADEKDNHCEKAETATRDRKRRTGQHKSPTANMRTPLYGQQTRIYPFTDLLRESILIRYSKDALFVLKIK